MREKENSNKSHSFDGLTEVTEMFEEEDCCLMVVEDVSAVLTSSHFLFVSENQY